MPGRHYSDSNGVSQNLTTEADLIDPLTHRHSRIIQEILDVSRIDTRKGLRGTSLELDSHDISLRTNVDLSASRRTIELDH